MAKKEQIKQTVKEIYLRKDEKFFKDKDHFENIDTLRERKLKEYIEKQLVKIENGFAFLCGEFESRFAKNEWILMSEPVFYVPSISSFIPDLKEKKCYSQSSRDDFYITEIDEEDLNFEDFKGKIPTEDEARIFLDENIGTEYRTAQGKIICDDEEYFGVTCGIRDFLWTTSKTSPNYGKTFEYGNNSISGDVDILTVPIYRVKEKEKNAGKISASEAILFWIKKDLRPAEFKEKMESVYNALLSFYRMDNTWLESRDNKIVFSKKDEVVDYFYKIVIKGEKIPFLGDTEKILKSNEFEADDKFIAVFSDVLLNCDSKRAGLEKLTPEILTGPRMGHWDLFDYIDEKKKNDSNYFKVIFPDGKELKAFSPNMVKSTVAIDFGTKSTVVAFEDSTKAGEIIPIKVGLVSAVNKKIDPYENPSSVQFVDFESFLKAYNSREGRPNTKWDDLTVAHTALNNLQNAKTSNYYSFMTDLKSWCYSKVAGLSIKDEKGVEKIFPVFSDLKDGDLNPLEYYAYFLGLYINTMSKQNVYTKYKMSFPVIPEPKIRERIRSSFERGIRKSFPSICLADEDFNKSYSVKEGLSEPAAYAITALINYHFTEKMDKEDLDRCYYAVFDFGGGTTDFNFGYCNRIDEDDEDDDDDKYFELNYFGNDSDPDLGGEKLLKYLAFTVFKDNRDKLQQSKNGYKIQFTEYPGCTASETFEFNELISNDSAYANVNMNTLMEKLRWVWEDPKAENDEEHQQYLRTFEEGGKITLNVFDFEGKEDTIELVIKSKDGRYPNPVDYFQHLLRDRIEVAVERFFSAMKAAFAKDVDDINEIAIFLAGNSTKSVLFNEILDEYLDSSSDKGREIKENFGNPSVKFELYPRLGSEKAKDKLQEIISKYGIKVRKSNKETVEPTGKTGVAYGLLLADKVVIDKNAIKSTKEARFKYYVGTERRGKFKKAVIKKDSKIDRKWIKLCKVKEDKYEYRFLYTTLPDAAEENTLDSRDASYNIIDVPEPEEDTEIFIRAISPDEIEWQVVESEEDLRENAQNPNIIDLKE